MLLNISQWHRTALPPTVTQPRMSAVLRLSPALQHAGLGNAQHAGNKPEKLIKKPDRGRPYSLCQGSFFTVDDGEPMKGNYLIKSGF